MQTKSSFIDRAIAAYIGFAVGDAFGATTEFMTPGEIRYKYKMLKDIVGGGWLNLRQGNVTDDTSLSVATGRSIVENGSYNTKNILEYFVKWMKSKPVDIGNTTRQSIVRYIKKGSLYSQFNEYNAGNGGLTRVVPVVIYGKDNKDLTIQMCIDQGRTTHNHPLSDLAIENYSAVLHSLLNDGDKMKALEIASDFIIKYPKFSFSRFKGENSGYIIDTYKSIMNYFFDGDCFESTLIKIVNNGGDADTIAALAGALCGALYGIEGIPKRWLNKLNRDILDIISFQAISLCNLPVKVVFGA